MSEPTPPTPTLRIFISSPGDVAEEREKARQVLAQLQAFYGEQVLLVPVLWEDLPLELDAAFQPAIDVILGKNPIDIAVFILWSRLGSPVGKSVLDREGKPYRSGTEREFDLMLAALEQSGGQRPDILFYRRDDDPTFKRKLSDEPDPGKMRDLMTQSEMAQSFVQEHFQDEEGHNTRAYHRFRQPVEFASRLKVHLRGLIDQRIDVGDTQRAARWMEAPYRGLEVFDLRHADIFFGREAEVCELETRLRQRESEGCAFVAVIGASGSGKSSLARAGLQASLTRFNLDEKVKEWRSAVLLPAQTEGQPLLGLTQALPDLTKSGLSATEIAEAFAESPSTTVKIVLKPIFQPSTKNQEPGTKVLVIVDQFEELFTDPRIASAERDRFLLALEALARSGFCWVVITMRSDFYPVAQKNEIFLRLKGETGHFDLLAPGPEALRRIITEPARMAGLRFEKRAPELGGQSLVGKILEDAKGQPDMLPLLSDLLLELYQLRSKENVVTFAAYESMGDEKRTGLEGALSKRADKEFAKLTPQQQATCPEILHALVTVEADADVRRRANLAALRDTPQKAGLIDAFIAARLLTADGPTVSLAHEALLRKWDRVADWVRDNRAFLRIRSRVEQALKRWTDAGNRSDLLLPEGLDLEEAAALLKDAPLLLAGSEYEPVRAYITASQDHHEKRRRRIEATRRTVTFFLVLLTLGASGAAVFGYLQAKAAGKQRDAAFYNDGQGALLRAQVAKQEGNRFPDQFFHLGRAIGFDGFGRAEDAGPGGVLDQARSLLGIGAPADPYPVLITTQRDKLLHDRIRGDIATLPSYLPVWTSGPGTGAAVTGADFSPDGRFLVAGFADGSVRRWDFSTTEGNATVLRPAGSGAVVAVRFRPDGKECVVADSSGATLWKEAGSETLLSGATTAFAWAPDGKAWAAGLGDGKLTGFRAGAAQAFSVPENPSPATSLAFSPDGRTLAAGSADGSLRLLDAITGQERSVLIAQDTVPVTSIVFHPAGAWLAAANAEGWVRFWSADGSEISHPQSSAWGMDPDAKIKLRGADLAFSPDGRRLAIGTNEAKGGFAKLWGVEAPAQPRELATLAHHAPTSPVVAFAPDGANLVTATDDGTLVLWDVRALPWMESGGKLDLAVYFQDGLFRFAEQEPAIGSGPPGFRNLRPDSLPGLWKEGGDAGALFARLVKSGNLAAATVMLERLPTGHPGREDLAAALLTSAGDAAGGYQWALAGERLDRLAALGSLSKEMSEKVRALAVRRPGQEGQSFPNGLEKMEMIWCPKGKFLRGEEDERHEVTLTPGFWIAKHEVTQAQWQAMMRNQPWNFVESGPDAPVENVSWEDAMNFCRKLTERERAAGALPDGWEYSLPTEAQWEYACRAGTSTVYSFGDEEERLGDYAWYDENSESKTHPVGLKKPNQWGLHDMHGNVWEWCFDWYDDYPTEAVTDPLGAKEGVSRVYRGGSWDDDASYCRAADRYRIEPSIRYISLGFRPACVPSR